MKKGAADFMKKDLNTLVGKDFNGWEVKAFALAAK